MQARIRTVRDPRIAGFRSDMLHELAGDGWTVVEPPLPTDDNSTVARFSSEPIKAGFSTERIEDSPEKFHAKYRSGKYDLELKIDFDIGRGQVRVEEVEAYS